MEQTGAPRDERSIYSGYGECGNSDCNCKAYLGGGDTCSNCGHNFGTHW